MVMVLPSGKPITEISGWHRALGVGPLKAGVLSATTFSRAHQQDDGAASLVSFTSSNRAVPVARMERKRTA